mmetsp:Transcript_18622/g.46484  ORF Transcript_18622/g.46484 Transcript_18622/m.46484 type:complete len:243 (+) Transcript_18622:1347-2075(+)
MASSYSCRRSRNLACDSMSMQPTLSASSWTTCFVHSLFHMSVFSCRSYSVRSSAFASFRSNRALLSCLFPSMVSFTFASSAECWLNAIVSCLQSCRSSLHSWYSRGRFPRRSVATSWIWLQILASPSCMLVMSSRIIFSDSTRWRISRSRRLCSVMYWRSYSDVSICPPAELAPAPEVVPMSCIPAGAVAPAVVDESRIGMREFVSTDIWIWCGNETHFLDVLCVVAGENLWGVGWPRKPKM